MAYSTCVMHVLDSDLTTFARIRNAALAGFASDGVAATSIRDVARAAGVSPGLVQHHFPTKAALGQAVNDDVAAIAIDAFRDVPAASSAADASEELELASPHWSTSTPTHCYTSPAQASKQTLARSIYSTPS